MKTSVNLCVAVLCLVLVGACEESFDESPLNEDLQLIQDGIGNPNTVNSGLHRIPFKSKFYTLRNYDEEGIGFCTEDPYLEFNYQKGRGKGTHLGNFTTIIGFCEAGFDYKNGEGVFIAANGDELYFQIPSPGEVGHVLPYDDPFYEFQFQDPFSFNGGTGRFEGASGGGYTNSFVDLFDDEGNFIPEFRTDHKWTGTLILQNGNKIFGDGNRAI